MAKLILQNSNGTIDVASNNHQESDTLMRYCLGLIDVENRVVCVKSNDTDVFTIMLGNYEKLNGLTLLIDCSNEKWIKLIKVNEQLGAGKANALVFFHCFSGCDTVENLLESPKIHEQKFSLSRDLDVFKTF